MFFPTLGVIATTDVVSVTIHQTIQEALSAMHVNDHRRIVVINQSVHYIITTQDMITLKVSGIDFNTPLSQVSLKQMPLLNKESNVLNALNLTNEMDESICVCNDDGTLYGLVTNSDIVASVDPQVILESLQIGTVFDKKYGFKSFEPDTLMAHVLDYMKDSLSDCVIIQEDNRPIGILTSKDVLHFIGDDACHSLSVSTVMSAPIETLVSTASISDALAFLRKRNYKRIVVTDESGHIMGIVTQQDLISRTYLRWSQLVHEHMNQFEELTQILQQKNKHLTELATKDALTDIHNRHMFAELFSRELAVSKRQKSKLVLAMIDLDYFKRINDAHGHNIGDHVLKNFAKMVHSTVREADLFARWGGEEFVLLLRDVSCEEAFYVAEKIRMLLEAKSFEEVGQVTCSIGVAEVNPDDTLHSAIGRADEALYVAKNEGRNRTISCRIKE